MDDPESRPERDPAGPTVTVRVRDTDGKRVTDLSVERGTVLRDALLEAGISPYARLTKRANCGGRGLCATCGVRIRSGEPTAHHWHDDLAARFGYPRLSCQIRVDESMTVELVEKTVWGGRE
ncbi:2Fe-2S iron-sulfur cluster binding domain-containing protein [Haloferax gibbonsii ATCC 33959]|uniref:2Fe-2S iron-sulfur cluster binding domain-containing protein n=1 Tax=Haloferax gibbonsii (strain ATCC 33959 / DSM 4427 / JCM 8863 / NBRC 102184 / NCIMB 2188 / Ma 2.38) TaxID=1227459 RepID=M0H5L1_HALGM|nr:2Fe-2S iron-sulfur cluster-binding protein [Haloferax gibbonsii]ELZ79043.1 2Fe-2S iron-sulfur cluster binding domain-containing protein [Haloferax gibbonsii ATCC 33959]